MPQSPFALIARDDTFFGVCQALGEDFGFHPNWLRIAIAPLLMVNPVAVIGGYAAAGVLVYLSRWLAPEPATVPASEWTPAVAEGGATNDGESEMAVAA